MAFDFMSVYGAGALISFLGIIVIGAAYAGYTGKSSKGTAGLMGLALFVVGLIVFAQAGGLVALQAQPTAPSTGTGPTTGALWSVKASASHAYPLGNSSRAPTVIVAPDGSRIDYYGSLSGSTPSFGYATSATFDSLNVTFVVINLNSGLNTQQWQITMSYGAVDSVSSPSTGATYPLFVPSTSDPSTYTSTWTSGIAGKVTQSGKTAYESITAGGSSTVYVNMNINGNAFAAMTVGVAYNAHFVVGGVDIPVTFHPTS